MGTVGPAKEAHSMNSRTRVSRVARQTQEHLSHHAVILVECLYSKSQPSRFSRFAMNGSCTVVQACRLTSQPVGKLTNFARRYWSPGSLGVLIIQDCDMQVLLLSHIKGKCEPVSKYGAMDVDLMLTSSLLVHRFMGRPFSSCRKSLRPGSICNSKNAHCTRPSSELSSVRQNLPE